MNPELDVKALCEGGQDLRSQMRVGVVCLMEILDHMGGTNGDALTLCFRAPGQQPWFAGQMFRNAGNERCLQ